MTWHRIKALWSEPRLQSVPIHFGFGTHRLALRFSLIARCASLAELLPAVAPPSRTGFDPAQQEPGYFIEGLEARDLRQGVQVKTDCIVYVPYFYDRYYIDFRTGLSEYTQSLARWKPRQIARKHKALQVELSVDLRFVCYERGDDIDEFFRAVHPLMLAQQGQHFATLRADADFQRDSREAAQNGRLVCYALCQGDTAISYLYCPVVAGAIVYQYLGFDRRLQRFSPGLILLWAVIRNEFERMRYQFFDFTKGSGQQKRIFASGKVTCGDVFVLPKRFPIWILTTLHNIVCRISYAIELQMQGR